MIRPPGERRLRRLPQHQKGAAEVGGDHSVERLNIELGDRRERQDACGVHHHIEPAEGLDAHFKQALDLGGVGNVRLDGHRPSSSAVDLIHDTLGAIRLA